MRLGLLTVVFGLSACSAGETDPGPGAATVEEAKALGEAAAMLDEPRPPAPGASASAEPAR